MPLESVQMLLMINSAFIHQESIPNSLRFAIYYSDLNLIIQVYASIVKLDYAPPPGPIQQSLLRPNDHKPPLSVTNEKTMLYLKKKNSNLSSWTMHSIIPEINPHLHDAMALGVNVCYFPDN